ncbi:MAG: transposase family protein [Gammaproteobacteria bacterium]|nr:transposase family protein [Gammaproteobacteria bacterium]
MGSSGSKLSFCQGCAEGKMARRPFKTSSMPKTTQLLELVHSDVCGPMSVKSPGGKRYIAAFLDDYSRYCRLYFLQHKSEAFDAFIDFKTWAEKQTSHQLKRFRYDGEVEEIWNLF